MADILYNNNNKILRFINSPVSSNCYLIHDKLTNECIVIDPGTKIPLEIEQYIDSHELKLVYILLTHEHFDHVWGADYLRKKYSSKIICSNKCKEKLDIPQNYFNLLYYNSDEEFNIRNVDVVVYDGYVLKWGAKKICFIETPGHSSSSICISIDNCLFSGDTIMNGFKPFIKKRHEGSLIQFKDSIAKVYLLMSDNCLVYPGHGDVFNLGEVKPFYNKFFNQ